MSTFRRNRKNNFYFHDDRSTDSNFVSKRHVSFQSGPGTKKRDSNVDMNVRVDLMNRNRSRHLRYAQFDLRGRKPYQFRRMLPTSSSGWYRVTLCRGKKYGRQDIMRTLQSFIQHVPFVPVGVKMEEDDMIFFVDNQETAQAISAANLKLQMKDGWKMQIKVGPNMPFVELSAALKERIRVAMSSKFDVASQGLDLSKFHTNEEFQNNDLFVPLNRQNMLLAVFQIIGESVPNLRHLNLSDNKIFSTEHFVILKRHSPDLKSLDLSKNKISDLSKLECLQGLKLEVLILDENPLCDKFQDQTTYVREVRKIFRTLLHLDGVDLPPPVQFDNDDNQTKLPMSHGSFLCSADGRVFSRQFLEQYFAIYDNRLNRDTLAEAYAENAQFSMTAFSSAPGIVLSKYITESRNLKKVNQFERRSKLLHSGKAEIVRFLNTLPKTQHDLPSFVVDLTTFRPELISLSLCGVFRETDLPPENKIAIKAFSRTFVLVPTGSGFNIVNDMLTITNPSTLQLASAFLPQPLTSLPTSPPDSLNTTPIARIESSSTVSSPEEAELNRKRELVTALAMQSGMNLMWSEKCLVETNWDFNNALYAFTEFNKLGKIPAEAFNK